jgi:hypothetical protein
MTRASRSAAQTISQASYLVVIMLLAASMASNGRAAVPRPPAPQASQPALPAAPGQRVPGGENERHSTPAAAARGQARAVCLARAPAIDGTLRDPLWQEGPVLALGEVTSPAASPLKTTARVLFDERNLYVAVQCAAPDTAGLETSGQTQDDPMADDDCIDLFICPDLDRGFRHVRVNAAGTVMDEACRPDGARIAAWDSQARVKTSVQKREGWTATLAVPLANLDAYAGRDLTWGFNVTRYRPAHGDSAAMQSSWAILPICDFHQPHAFGRLRGINILPLPDGAIRERATPAVWPETVGYLREEIEDTTVNPDDALVNVRVACNRWPDCYSNATSIASICRIEGAADKSDQDKALALWKWFRILVSPTCGGYCYETDAGGTSTCVTQSHKIFTVYGHHMCDGQSWAYAPLWRAAGYLAFDECHTGHTYASLRYKDADGQYRFHDFDPQTRIYWWDEQNQRVASSRIPLLRGRVHRHLIEPQTAHTLRTSLRIGETLERTWDNQGNVVQAGPPAKMIVLKGPYEYWPGRWEGVYTAVGQEMQVLKADTTPEHFRDALAAGSTNVACSSPGKGKAALHPAEGGRPARFIYRLPSPYVAVNAVLDAVLRKGSEADLCQLSLSTDGGFSWKPIHTMQTTGSQDVHVDLGTDARAEDKPDIYTAYEFLIKAEFRSDTDPAAVGMNSLKVTAYRQLNKRTLPNLMPGSNVLRVTADRMAPGWLLEVRLAYSVDGKSFEQTRLIDRFPFYFQVDTGDFQEDYAKVIDMKLKEGNEAPQMFDVRFNNGRLRMQGLRMRLVKAAGLQADESMPAGEGEGAFAKPWPHPVNIPGRHVQRNQETNIIETNGFFPQEHNALHDREKMNALFEQMRTGKTEMAKWQAIEDLGAYPEAFDALLSMVERTNGDVLLHLCKALAQRADKRAVAPLLARWQNVPRGAPGVRYIPDVLAAIGDRGVVPDLVRPLKGLRFDFRFHIVYALGVLGGPLAGQTLQDLAANDPVPCVRQLAAEELGKVQPRNQGQN